MLQVARLHMCRVFQVAIALRVLRFAQRALPEPFVLLAQAFQALVPLDDSHTHEALFVRLLPLDTHLVQGLLDIQLVILDNILLQKRRM